MSTLVESLKRLFMKGTLSKEKLKERVERDTISKEEYTYITGEQYEKEE